MGKAIFTAGGLAVMSIPAVVPIIWRPSAVCLVICGLFLIGYGRRIL